MQRLTLTPITDVAGLRREHQPQSVNDVRACLLPRATLAEHTSHLGDRRNDPAFLAGLVDDRQIKLLRHQLQDIATESPGAGQTDAPGADRSSNNDLLPAKNGEGGKVLEISVASDPTAS
jgi:hypothetical protein